MINQEYKERVRLLLRIIPIISAEECFAVHGGTAINLFVQNLPGSVSNSVSGVSLQTF